MSSATAGVSAAQERAIRAQALRDAADAIQHVYDLQCPVLPLDAYVDEGAQMAHRWWQVVLGGELKRLRARAEQLEAKP